MHWRTSTRERRSSCKGSRFVWSMEREVKQLSEDRSVQCSLVYIERAHTTFLALAVLHAEMVMSNSIRLSLTAPDPL